MEVFRLLSPHTTPLATLFLYCFVISLGHFLINLEFVTFPGLSVERNAPIEEFREKFAAALRKRERGDNLPKDKSCNESNRKAAALVNAPTVLHFRNRRHAALGNRVPMHVQLHFCTCCHPAKPIKINS